MSNYQWVITVDHITGGQRVGTVGPRDAALDGEAIKHHPKGQPFKLKDDDGQTHFEGVYVGPDDETLFAPLEDFGTPDTGCTDILYRDEKGRWEFL